MPPILSIETATSVCSVAIHDQGRLIAQAEFHIEKVHATSLTPTIAFLLTQSNVKWSDLAAIAVSKGPGSYTGLRIGVAVAKGLCFTHNIPLIGIETLEAMARSMAAIAERDGALICAMLDARRMEVYYSLYKAAGELLVPAEAVVINDLFLQTLLHDRNIIFGGNGVDKCKPLLQPFQNAYVVNSVYPLAKWVGELATVKFGKGQFENLTDFEPYYLKEFFKPSK